MAILPTVQSQVISLSINPGKGQLRGCEALSQAMPIMCAAACAVTAFKTCYEVGCTQISILVMRCLVC